MPKLYIAAVLLALSIPGTAQPAPSQLSGNLPLSRPPLYSIPSQELSIKGHIIGQSLADFLASEPGLYKQFNKCTTHHRIGGNGCIWVAELEVHNRATVSGQAPGPVWALDGNSLTGVTLFMRGDYAEVRNDLSARLKSEPAESEVDMQNGFGARWTERHATWMSAHYYVSIDENRNPTADYNLFLRVETRKSYDAEQSKAKSKPSPLD